jgi:DNA-binding NarL/FixJ family response regulator
LSREGSQRDGPAEPPAQQTAVTPQAGFEVSIVECEGGERLVLSFPLRPARWPECLTQAERAVAELVLEGASNAAIAKARGTSARTVANQVATIFRKLEISSRVELAARIFGASRG